MDSKQQFSGTQGTPDTYKSLLSPPVALSIAGFDPSNGAGVTADLQVFSSYGLFGISAITALTVQNTLGVESTHPTDPKVLAATLRNLASDLPPAGIKIGMLATAEVVQVVVDFLREVREGKHCNRNIPIVLDPIVASSSGSPLLDQAGLDLMKRELLDLVTVITPNRQELGILTTQNGMDDFTIRATMSSSIQTHANTSVIATNGEGQTPLDIVLDAGSGTFTELASTRIETTSTHGTGCAFSSALLSNLILGKSLTESATYAKKWVEQALRTAPTNLGKGRGPMKLNIQSK